MTPNSNLLFVLPAGAIGGAERVLFNLADSALRFGARVTVYVMSKPSKDGWAQLNRYAKFSLFENSARSEKQGLIGLTSFLIRSSRESSFDFVLSSHAHINALLSALRKLRLLKCGTLVARESTLIFDRFFGVKRFVFLILYRYLYGAQDLLICQTEEMRDSLVRSLGFSPARRVVVLQNPVNIDYLTESICGSRLALDGYPVVVAAGRLIELKGFHFLIEAFGRLSTDHPSARLYLLGDGPQRGELEGLASQHGVSHLVTFVGRVANPYEWFSKADIGVCSSRIEGFPNVLIEMMASGTKCIVSSPCTKAVTSLPGVVLSDSWLAADLAHALENVFGKAPDLRMIYGRFVSESCSVSAYWTSIEKAVM